MNFINYVWNYCITTYHAFSKIYNAFLSMWTKKQFYPVDTIFKYKTYAVSTGIKVR